MNGLWTSHLLTVQKVRQVELACCIVVLRCRQSKVKALFWHFTIVRASSVCICEVCPFAVLRTGAILYSVWCLHNCTKDTLQAIGSLESGKPGRQQVLLVKRPWILIQVACYSSLAPLISNYTDLYSYTITVSTCCNWQDRFVLALGQIRLFMGPWTASYQFRAELSCVHGGATLVPEPASEPANGAGYHNEL